MAIFLIGLIPFSILYIIADMLYYILRYIIRYRYAVIKDNLSQCFPDFSPAQIQYIISDCYKNLADITVEGIKGLTMSKEELMQRYPFHQIEQINAYLDEGQSVILAPVHYGNWEWSVIAYGLFFPHRAIGIYKPIHNIYIERDINKRRSRGSLALIPTTETRKIKEELTKGRAIIFMADQNPSNTKEAHWMKFFNRDTACLHGMEKYANSYQLPVFFADMQRIKRGHYSLTFNLIAENPATLKVGELTQMYMSLLEERIRKKPGDWLWSHKRWKHRRQLF